MAHPMTGTMSKALEAAHEAGVEAFKVRFSADCSAVDALTDYRDALLAHLAEDEAVVKLCTDAMYIETKAGNYPSAEDVARAILRTLAGKE